MCFVEKFIVVLGWKAALVKPDLAVRVRVHDLMTKPVPEKKR